MRCVACHAELGPEDRFCGDCAHPVEATPIERTCPGCGNAIAGDEAFCGACGRRVGFEPSPPSASPLPSTPPRPPRRRKALVVGALLVVLGGGATLWGLQGFELPWSRTVGAPPGLTAARPRPPEVRPGPGGQPPVTRLEPPVSSPSSTPSMTSQGRGGEMVVTTRPGAVQGSAPSTEGTPMTGLLESTDIHGGLIRYFPLDQARVDLCARACASDGECRAYTYVKPGAYNAGDAPMCYLKSSVDRTVVNPRVISGIVRDGPVAPRATAPPATTSRAPSPRCTELEAPLSTLRHGTAEQLGWGALGHRIKVNELRVAYTDHLSRLWQAAARALPEVADGRFGEFVQQHRDRSAATYEDFARAAAEFTAPAVDPRVSALARERIEQAQKAARSMRETIGAPLTRQSAQALVNKFLNTLAQSRQSLSGEIEADRQALAVNTTKRKALDAERQRLGCIVARE